MIGSEFKVLDDGFVRVVNFSGDDFTAVKAARLTSGTSDEESDAKKDETLIRYLIRHKHHTPLEFANLTVHLRIPMDAWRQGIRHRLFSINESSTRYSEAIDSSQTTTPTDWRKQASNNRQGSEGCVTDWPEEFRIEDYLYEDRFSSPGRYLSSRESDLQNLAREVYEERLRFGVAREQARKDLPLSTYTEAWVECDLRGWLHFLELRMDSHAQKEIREYANVIGQDIIAKLFPITWKAFCDYQLDSCLLTALDIEVMRRLNCLSPRYTPPFTYQEFLECQDPSWRGLARCRERDECYSKLLNLGMVE